MENIVHTSNVNYAFDLTFVGVMCIYSMVKIWKLMQASKVAPAPALVPAPAPAHVPAHTPTSAITKQARKALILIMQVSGAYWCAHIPSSLIRIIIFNLGYTWDDLDTRRYLVPSILVRLGSLLYVPIAPVVNPVFYYYSRKDLREAFLKLCGRRSQVVPF